MSRSRLVVLFVLYLGVVAASVLGPNPGGLVDRGVGKAHRMEIVARAAARGEPASNGGSISREGLIRGLTADDLGNVALFLPFGVLFPVALPRWRRRTIVVGAALSATIELTQQALLAWRVSTVRDVVSNSLGVALGLALVLTTEALLRRRGQRR
ncbi:MAG: VanZ family protein, partial [Microthrixaceae bacterium]